MYNDGCMAKIFFILLLPFFMTAAVIAELLRPITYEEHLPPERKFLAIVLFPIYFPILVILMIFFGFWTSLSEGGEGGGFGVIAEFIKEFFKVLTPGSK